MNSWYTFLKKLLLICYFVSLMLTGEVMSTTESQLVGFVTREVTFSLAQASIDRIL